MWLPTAKVEVVKVAWPEVRARLAARTLMPSWKLTVPVGVPEPGAAAVIVAVKVTFCPNTEGFAVELTETVLVSWFTTCGDAESSPLLGRKLPSPEYDAVIVWLPSPSEEMVNVACPEESVTPEANVVDPSVKIAVPVGVPAAGATALTVAVKVTVWPKTDGCVEEVIVVVLEAMLTT